MRAYFRINNCLPGFVTKEYKSEQTLLHYGVMPLLKSGQMAIVEFYSNWDNRYKRPDYTKEVVKC